MPSEKIVEMELSPGPMYREGKSDQYHGRGILLPNMPPNSGSGLPGLAVNSPILSLGM